MDNGLKQLVAVVAGAALCLVATTASAEIQKIKGEPGNVCFSPECVGLSNPLPLLQGRTTVYTLYGPSTRDVAKAAVSNLNVFSSILFEGPGILDPSSWVRVTLTVRADAPVGVTFIGLRNNQMAKVGDIEGINFVVVRNGKVTALRADRQPNYFTEADVVLEGENIGGASAQGDFPGVLVSTTVVSRSDTRTVVRLRFQRPLGQVTGTIRLWDAQCPACAVPTNTPYFYSGSRTVTITGPNEVAEITAKTGTFNGFIVGQTTTVRFKLRRPVENLTATTAPSRTLSPTTSSTLEGVWIHWTVDLPNNADPASGRVLIKPGQDWAEVPVRGLSTYLAGSTSYAIPAAMQVRARIGDPNAAVTSPAYKAVTFPMK